MHPIRALLRPGCETCAATVDRKLRFRWFFPKQGIFMGSEDSLESLPNGFAVRCFRPDGKPVTPGSKVEIERAL